MPPKKKVKAPKGKSQDDSDDGISDDGSVENVDSDDEEEKEDDADEDEEEEDLDDEDGDNYDYADDGSVDELIDDAAHDSDEEGDGEDEEDEESDDDDTKKCMYSYDAPMEEYKPYAKSTRVPDEDRITQPILSIYEAVRILGIRAHQIAERSKTLVANVDGYSPLEIAIFELKNGKMPLIIKRPMPGNTYEEWKVKDLRIKKGFDPSDAVKISRGMNKY
jgi:DNA-directed RNA polymerase subunit K/omega